MKLLSKSHLNLYHLDRNLRWQIGHSRKVNVTKASEVAEKLQGSLRSWERTQVTFLTRYRHHSIMNNILWNLLALSEVLLPAISNTCVPWWGFRQSNRSVGQRKSGQHMSLTAPREAPGNGNVPSVWQTKPGVPTTNYSCQSPKGWELEPPRKDPAFSLCRGSSGSTSSSHLESLYNPAAHKCAPGTPW